MIIKLFSTISWAYEWSTEKKSVRRIETAPTSNDQVSEDSITWTDGHSKEIVILIELLRKYFRPVNIKYYYCKYLRRSQYYTLADIFWSIMYSNSVSIYTLRNMPYGCTFWNIINCDIYTIIIYIVTNNTHRDILVNFHIYQINPCLLIRI